MKVAVLGYGYWGPNLVRNFCNVKDCKVEAVADVRPERLKALSEHYPEIKGVSAVDGIFSNAAIDAVVIATPISTHYEFAADALRAGKHVLVEKPLTTSSKEASHLMQLAKQHQRVLMADHTFLFTGAVKEIKRNVEQGLIGKLQFFDSTRINLGLFQSDVNVVWDLAPHDISILLFITDELPESVSANGVSHTGNGIENIAYLTLHYKSGMIAHLNCSWSSPVKIRTILIGGDKKAILYNDIEPTEKVKIYDSGFSVNSDDEKKKILIDYRVGNVAIPKLDTEEALSSLVRNFTEVINGKSKPLVDPELPVNVVRIIEAAQLSMKNNGNKQQIFYQ